jgi:hypothetical protein
VAAAGALAGIGTAWIVVHGGPDRPAVPNLPLAVPLAVLIGWSFIGSGLLYRRTRPTTAASSPSSPTSTRSSPDARLSRL